MLYTDYRRLILRKLVWELLICIFICFSIFLVGCSNSQLDDISAEEIIARTSARMVGMESFEFLIERSGESALLNVEESISFRRADGSFINPDQVQANVRVIAPGLVADVQIIRIGDEQWETNILTGNWQISDPRYSFNLTRLFDPDVGIHAIIEHDLFDPILLGFEELPEIPGKQLYAVEATLLGDGAYRMSYGLIDKEPLYVKIWVDPKNFDLHRILMIDPADPGDEEDTIWQFDIWNFNKTFVIEKPKLSNE